MAKKKRKKTGGRQAERLRIVGDWTDAVAKALKRGKPPDEPAKKPKSNKT